MITLPWCARRKKNEGYDELPAIGAACDTQEQVRQHAALFTEITNIKEQQLEILNGHYCHETGNQQFVVSPTNRNRPCA